MMEVLFNEEGKVLNNLEESLQMADTIENCKAEQKILENLNKFKNL